MPIKPRHHVATEAMRISDCLIRHFRQEAPRAAELISLGAVYRNKERVENDGMLAKGDHVLAYLTPTRFSMEGVDWNAVTIQESPDFVVIDKPSGMPVHATADNLRDNVLFQLRERTGKTLLVTQRLDTPVSGLLVLAKTPEFQRHFNRLLAEGQVEKTYRLLAVKKVEPGAYRHFLEPTEKAPRGIQKEEKKGWLPADLDVLSASSVTLPVSPRPFVQMEVRLRTGRTHQIRAQLAALGAPIVGDKLYGSTIRYSKLKYGRGIALVSCGLSWEGGPRFSLAAPWE